MIKNCKKTKIVINFFLMMRMFKVYSLSYFEIYNTVLLTTVTMMYVTSP